MKIALPLLLLGLAAASPAFAQEDTPFTDAVLMKAGSCFDAPPESTFATLVALCTKADEDMAQMRVAKIDATSNELSIYYAMSATVLTTLGGAQAQVDQSRSARSCQTQERAWASASRIDPSTSLSHGADMRQVKADVGRVITICRKDFPAPAGAPPSP